MSEHHTHILPLTVELAIVDGPSKGGSIRVPVGSSLVLGRDYSADERLGGDMSLSGRHAKLEHLQPGYLTLIDLHSTNGVYVAGRRIAEPTEINPGERIEMGRTVLVLEPVVRDDRTLPFSRVESGPAQTQALSYEEQIREGYRLLETDQTVAAEGAFARATGLSPERAEGHLVRGVALMKLDRLDEASRALGDAVRRDGSLTEGWYRLGVVAQVQGDAEKALGYYRHALTLDCAHGGAREGVERLAPRPGTQQSSPTTEMPTTDSWVSLPPQPGTLAAAVDAAAKGDGLPSWDQGELLKSAHRAVRSFGRHWLVVIALFGLALSTEPLLNALLTAVKNGDGQVSPLESTIFDIYNKHAALTTTLLVLAGFTAALIILGSIFTQYHIYERRIDFNTGVLFRRKSSVWLYDVIDIDSERSPLMLLTNTAALALRSETGKVEVTARAFGKRRGKSTVTIDRMIGVGTARAMEELWRTLRSTALRERRAMKSQWV
jgi:tetratricopeptide (TPR) repeat protein